MRSNLISRLPRIILEPNHHEQLMQGVRVGETISGSILRLVWQPDMQPLLGMTTVFDKTKAHDNDLLSGIRSSAKHDEESLQLMPHVGLSVLIRAEQGRIRSELAAAL
jgi:hypothetical protein